MALSNHCDACNSAWPQSASYSICPRCRTRTRTAVLSNVMTPAEAREHLRLLKWERFYSQHEEKRERLGRPSPEEIGRREAAEIIRLERQFS